MGQYWKLIDLDAESNMTFGKFGEFYADDWRWLINAITVNEDKTIGKRSRVAHRFICIGDYSSDIPAGLFSSYELSVLKSSHKGSEDLYSVFGDFDRWYTKYEQENRDSHASMALLNISKNEYITQKSVDVQYIIYFTSFNFTNKYYSETL